MAKLQIRRSIWIAVGISPLVSFFVVPAIQLCFGLFVGPIDRSFFMLEFIDQGTIVAGIFAVIASYIGTVVVGIPSFIILRYYGRATKRNYIAIGLASGIVYALFFLQHKTPFWITLTLASSILVAWVFAILSSDKKIIVG